MMIRADAPSFFPAASAVPTLCTATMEPTTDVEWTWGVCALRTCHEDTGNGISTWFMMSEPEMVTGTRNEHLFSGMKGADAMHDLDFANKASSQVRLRFFRLIVASPSRVA